MDYTDIAGPNSEARFSLEDSAGNSIPFRASNPGRSFRLGAVPENVSRSEAKNWAVVSAKHAIRKARPALSLNSGMHFPLKLLPENESHSEAEIWDAVSACSPAGKVHPSLKP